MARIATSWCSLFSRPHTSWLKITLSRTVQCGMSAMSWNIMPIFLLGAGEGPSCMGVNIPALYEQMACGWLDEAIDVTYLGGRA